MRRDLWLSSGTPSLSSVVSLTAEDRDSLWLGRLVLSISCVLLPDVEQHWMGSPVTLISPSSSSLARPWDRTTAFRSFPFHCPCHYKALQIATTSPGTICWYFFFDNSTRLQNLPLLVFRRTLAHFFHKSRYLKHYLCIFMIIVTRYWSVTWHDRLVFKCAHDLNN